ncbi:BlaI/MecI/CopY family transcriptional regulator [bacterium]|nr:BlaI/MecI/CopY family transcriptional regulator [bacterium]
MKELTKAEEQIMQVLWALQKAFVKEIIEELPEPRPAYNTVSTIVRILESKGFVDHEAFGKTHRYFPVVSKKVYSRFFLKRMITDYFDNSYQNMVSFFAGDKSMTLEELEELLSLIKNQIKEKQSGNDD